MTACLTPLARRTVPLSMMLCLLLGTLLHAQTPSPTVDPPPEPPLVLPAPQKVEWTVAYQWLDAKPGAAPEGDRLVSTTTTKIDDKQREVDHWGNGKQSERWIAGDLVMTQQPTWPPEMVVSEPHPPEEGDFDLGWLTLKQYQETVTLEGRKCHYYLAPDIPGARRGLKSEGGKEPMVKVWIDAKTRLPVMVQTVEVRKRYSYTVAAVASLTLPPAFAVRYERYMESKRRVVH